MDATARRAISISMSMPDDDPPPRPYHAKRPHKKSRAGCRNCKARKVKCDETRPTCRSCSLRKVDCIYPSAAAAAAAADAVAVAVAHQTLPSPPNNSLDSPSSGTHVAVFSSPSSSSYSTSVLSPARAPGPALGIQENDMKLLWFYATKTYSSFSTRHHEQPIEEAMKSMLVRYAFDVPFLMDSVFALSSLHMQLLNQEYSPGRALAYQARSFESYRRAIEEAKPETFPALVVNSLLIIAISSQVFRDPDGKGLYILDWMVVWRGIGLIIDLVCMSTLVKSGLTCLFYRPPMDLDKAASFIPNQLLDMLSSIRPDDPDYPCRQTYYDTLKYIGVLYMYLRQGPCPMMSLRVTVWLTFPSNHFAELARMRRPRALVIIAYCAVFFKLVEDGYWWMTGIGQRSLRDICNYLGPEWHNLLRVPLAALEVEDRTELARLILEDPAWTFNDQSQPPMKLTWVDDMGRELCFDENGQGMYADPTYPGEPEFPGRPLKKHDF